MSRTTFSLPEDIEEKTVTTYRHERSYNGYSASDLKSWLQKAIRRGDEKDAVWAAVEMYTIPKQAIVTNLFNRLRVIAMEDVGAANINATKLVDCILEKLQTDKGKSRLPVKASGVKMIATLVSYLARSKHIRLCSDYKAVFLTPVVREMMMAKFPGVYKGHQKIINKISEENDPKKLGSMVVKMLKKRDDKAFYPLGKILEFEKLPFKTYSSVKPQYYAMKCLEDAGLDKKIVAILVKWLKGGIANLKVEHNLPVYYGMSILLHMDKNLEEELDITEPKITNFTSKKIPKVPGYALDKHTLTGRLAGKTALDFAIEGARVENEDEDLLNKTHRKIYLESKVPVKKDKVKESKKDKAKVPVKKNKTKESEYADFIVRVQVNTSDAKADTYIARRRSDQKLVFIKGPYLTEYSVNSPVKAYEVKRIISPELPSIFLEKRRLVPDLFPDIPLGIRRKVDRAKSYWFLIAESLLEEPIPFKIHNTKKWVDEKVVDWPKVKEPKIPNPLKLSGKSLNYYVLNMFFRYFMGIGDPADRNFLLTKDGKIISTDEESIGSDPNFSTSLKKRRCETILKYVKNNWSTVSKTLKLWLERAGENKVGLKKILGKDFDQITRKLERLQKMKCIEDIFKV
jgi:hypothetical protein